MGCGGILSLSLSSLSSVLLGSRTGPPHECLCSYSLLGSRFFRLLWDFKGETKKKLISPSLAPWNTVLISRNKNLPPVKAELDFCRKDEVFLVPSISIGFFCVYNQKFQKVSTSFLQRTLRPQIWICKYLILSNMNNFLHSWNIHFLCFWPSMIQKYWGSLTEYPSSAWLPVVLKSSFWLWEPRNSWFLWGFPSGRVSPFVCFWVHSFP